MSDAVTLSEAKTKTILIKEDKPEEPPSLKSTTSLMLSDTKKLPSTKTDSLIILRHT
jgi:hypothetical protein